MAVLSALGSAASFWVALYHTAGQTPDPTTLSLIVLAAGLGVRAVIGRRA